MTNLSLLAIDFGEKRVGLALANIEAKLPRPLTTLQNDDQLMDRLVSLIDEHKVAMLVIGMPRNQQGNLSAQSEVVRRFTETVKKVVALPIFLQDESVTSVNAKQILDDKGKPYAKEDIDAMAAALILQDFIDTHAEQIQEALAA